MSSQNKWTSLQNILAMEEDKLKEPETNVSQDNVRPLRQSGPLPESGPPLESGPTRESGPLQQNALKPPPSLDIRASLPQTAGHTEVPHVYADHLCRVLTPLEQVVYFQLFRLSWGWKKETCFISNPRLAERTNLGESTVRKVIKTLVAKNLIERVGVKFGSDGEQGVTYRVLQLSGPLQQSGPASQSGPLSRAPIKEKVFKENNKKENELALDTKSCPDCQGSGFWYPEGVEKGVAKCRHERLKKGK